MFEASKRLTDFDYIDPKLGAAESTLPEELQKAGYKTAAFITGQYNGPRYGLNRGYDLYRHYISNSDVKKIPKKSFAAFLPEAYEWMAENKDAPFFVLLHSSELHRPYLPPEKYISPYAGGYKGVLASTWLSKHVLESIRKDGAGWSFSPDPSAADGEAERLSSKSAAARLSQADIDYVVARYDASIRYADEFVGEIVRWAHRSVGDNTIIIVMADHGEGLGDHGAFLHCTDPPRLYQELIHVPLIVHIPKKWLQTAVAAVAQPVELIDLVPTILDLVRAPSPRPEGLEGRSLLGIVTGEKKEEPGRAVFAETVGYGLRVQSVKAGDWKLIRTQSRGRAAPDIELYDLGSDPSEKKNIARRKPDIVRELLDRLNSWSDHHGK